MILVRQNNLLYLNQHAVAMVDLVLDNLRREAVIGFEARLKLLVLVLHLDCSIPFSLSSSSNSIVIEHREIGFRFLVKAFPLRFPDRVSCLACLPRRKGCYQHSFHKTYEGGRSRVLLLHIQHLEPAPVEL